MPRVYLNYRDENGACTGGGDPIDLCRACWGTRVDDLVEKYPSIPAGTIEEDCREAGPEGDDHPPYCETDYDCEVCGARLEDFDD